MPSALQHRRAAATALAAATLAAVGCGSVRSCASPPPAPQGQFLYAVHDAPDGIAPGVEPRITAFRIEPSTGALLPVADGASDARAVGAFSLAVDPSGRWFSLAGSQLALLRITASGALEAAAKPSSGLAGYFDPRGRYFYLVTGAGLAVFTVDPRRGIDLATPLHTEAGVFAFVMGSPRDGQLLYAAGEGLRAYTVGDHGKLASAPGSPHDLSVRALELAVHPSGRFVIVLGEARGRRLIAVLRAGADGSLDEVTGSPFDLGNDLRSMALSADGAYVFATDRDRHSVETFGLDAGGGLQPVASISMDVPEAGELTVDAQGRYLYASDMKAGVVHGFAIDGGGGLAAVPGSPFRVGPRVSTMVTTPRPEGPLQAAALPEPGAITPRSPEAARVDPSTFGNASLETLVAALDDPGDDTRYFAIVALERRRDLDAALPAIVNALDDPHEPVRRMARYIIGPWALAHPGAVDDEVLGRLASGNGKGTMLDNGSLSALHALKARGAVAAPYLAQALANSGQLRAEAMEALVDLGPAAAPAVPDLRRLLQRNSEVRVHAANALGWIGPPAAEAIPELYAMLDDPSPSAKRAAKFAIEQIRK